jgi:nucleoside phosphorylase
LQICFFDRWCLARNAKENTVVDKHHKKASGILGSATVAIMTITEQEFPAVRDIFALQQNIPNSGYYVANANRRQHEVVLRRSSGQTNLISAELAVDLIYDFRPEFVFLVGTGGGYEGRDELAVGDVVIADYVEFSGYWKYKDHQVLRRKIAHDQPSLNVRDNHAEHLRVTPEAWHGLINANRPVAGQPTVHIGEVVSGDILLGDPDNAEQKRILEDPAFDKALAFEMEAVGLARTVYKARKWVNYNPQFAVIRGISDAVNTNAVGNQATRITWTPYAVGAAAAVSKAIVDRILRAIQDRDKGESTIFERLKGVFRD